MRRDIGAPSLLVAVPLVLGALLAAPPRGVADEGRGGASLFVRGDSDRTVVIAPRTATGVLFNEDRTRLDAAYAADVWTSASIDIRTAATVPITEQRDQLDFSGSHEFDDVTLGASYYYSGETDYWSHGVTVRSVQEHFGGSSTFEESFRFVHDEVGRSGDPNTRPADSGTLRAVYTQIFSAQAIAQLVWEGTYRAGYQASPYRYVGLGGDGQCGGSAILCVPESHPTERIRNAFLLRGRYAFSNDTSAGLEYRFYVDDWGVTSHTAALQIGLIPAPEQVLTLRFRFYSQTAAAFYLAEYPEPTGQIRFVTRDRELSPLLSNRLAIAYQGRVRLSPEVSMKIAIAVGGTAFVYADFVGLDEVYSLDTTFALTLEL